VTSGWIVPASMFALMFGMGIALTAADFRRVVLMPGPTLLGTVLQLVAMPLVGLGLARAFGLDPVLAAGLMIVAACPGGVMSNVLCHFGRADTALSITLTATATAVTLFTIPLWVRVAVARAGALDMPVLATAQELALFTILPVAIGMGVRAVRPGAAAHEGWITRGSTAAMVVALTVEALRSDDPPVAAFTASLQPALLLCTAALALGLGVPLVLGIGWRDAATIAVELCIKNTVLGLFVATESLGSLEAAVPIAAVMTFQLPFGLGALALYHGWRRLRPTSA
jgi:BASS family bile acid:Na+ symporter